MSRWLSDNIVGVLSVLLASFLALCGFALWHSETLIRHDEQIKVLREDSSETQVLLNALRNDIGCIKENIVKISTYVENNNQKGIGR